MPLVSTTQRAPYCGRGGRLANQGRAGRWATRRRPARNAAPRKARARLARELAERDGRVEAPQVEGALGVLPALRLPHAQAEVRGAARLEHVREDRDEALERRLRVVGREAGGGRRWVMTQAFRPPSWGGAPGALRDMAAGSPRTRAREGRRASSGLASPTALASCRLAESAGPMDSGVTPARASCATRSGPPLGTRGRGRGRAAPRAPAEEYKGHLARRRAGDSSRRARRFRAPASRAGVGGLAPELEGVVRVDPGELLRLEPLGEGAHDGLEGLGVLLAGAEAARVRVELEESELLQEGDVEGRERRCGAERRGEGGGGWGEHPGARARSAWVQLNDAASRQVSSMLCPSSSTTTAPRMSISIASRTLGSSR